MTKRIAIIGKGTAGVLSALHMSTYADKCEFDWYYDDAIPTQAVGEGSTLVLPKNLRDTINFGHFDLDKIDGSFKLGIYKKNWGGSGEFMHPFRPPDISYHFNALKLQEFLFDKIKDRFKHYSSNVDAKDVDADFVMDCSGKPSDYDEFETAEYIPVNSVHVTQCNWDYTRFQYTLAIARPYGWVFGIPLATRCSIGYMYNNNLNTLDEVKEDVLHVLKEFNLVGSKENSFSFNNYYRKQNFSNDGRIAYNGNASFFLEPLEATSIQMIDYIQRMAFDIWNNTITVDYANSRYHNLIREIRNMIMLHYSVGSKFNSPFWDYAIQQGRECVMSLETDTRFREILNNLNNFNYNIEDYGTWTIPSFKVNLTELGLIK